LEVENPNQQKLRWKKILLIKPNSRVINTSLHQTRFDAPPLNLTYIASYLADLNVEVEILDAKLKNLNYRQIKKKIEKFNPDIVGISFFLSLVINICYDLAKLVKIINPNCLVVFGGRHPTAEPEETLKTSNVDIIVRGEGELTFRELIIKGTPENVNGISYKSNGIIIHNPDRVPLQDLENIRYPARHLIKKNKYKMFTVRFETVETSRGCPHRCKFCYTPIFGRGLWRSRPVEKIITELKMITQNRKITDIFFVDDNFAASTKRIVSLCDRIIECKRNKEISDLKFFAQIRVDSVIRSPQMVEKMANAGFCVVFMGIESASEETLKDIRKGFSFNKVIKAIRILHENNIIVLGNIIIGLDLNATMEDVRKEIEFMKEVNIDTLGFSILIPFPGTIILDELKERNLVLTKDWSKYTFLNPVIKTYQLSPKNMRELLCYTFKEHSYLKNGMETLLRIIKLRGLIFILNPIRLFLTFKSVIKMKIIQKKFLREIK
jgi:radical SAM superfamily enzyme YgiQ (UPF0313 family)